MKKRFLLFCLTVFSVALVSAQCSKKFKVTTERIYKVEADGSEGEDAPFSAEITFSKDSLILSLTMPDGNTLDILGKHSSTDCKMNADYTEGSIDFKNDAVMNAGGESREMKMNYRIEAKEGKMKIIAYPDEKADEKICFVVKEKVEVK